MKEVAYQGVLFELAVADDDRKSNEEKWVSIRAKIIDSNNQPIHIGTRKIYANKDS